MLLWETSQEAAAATWRQGREHDTVNHHQVLVRSESEPEPGAQVALLASKMQRA
jgi:hypothetical protein